MGDEIELKGDEIGLNARYLDETKTMWERARLGKKSICKIAAATCIYFLTMALMHVFM